MEKPDDGFVFLQKVVNAASGQFGPPVVIKAVAEFLRNTEVEPDAAETVSRLLAVIDRCSKDIGAILDDAVSPGT